jgi:hypothetical protein
VLQAATAAGGRDAPEEDEERKQRTWRADGGGEEGSCTGTRGDRRCIASGECASDLTESEAEVGAVARHSTSLTQANGSSCVRLTPACATPLRGCPCESFRALVLCLCAVPVAGLASQVGLASTQQQRADRRLLGPFAVSMLTQQLRTTQAQPRKWRGAVGTLRPASSDVKISTIVAIKMRQRERTETTSSKQKACCATMPWLPPALAVRRRSR